MRQTALPLLRDLDFGIIVSRCQFCGAFALADEACQSLPERQRCVPRAFIELIEHVPVAVVLAGEAML
jgi:hypothetical protein